jgi:hypothetical protein
MHCGKEICRSVDLVLVHQYFKVLRVREPPHREPPPPRAGCTNTVQQIHVHWYQPFTSYNVRMFTADSSTERVRQAAHFDLQKTSLGSFRAGPEPLQKLLWTCADAGICSQTGFVPLALLMHRTVLVLSL